MNKTTMLKQNNFLFIKIPILLTIFFLLPCLVLADLPPIPEIPSFPAITSNGYTYHVDKDIGNDSYTADQAQNPSTPWATIRHGLNHLVAGNTLIVHEAETAYIVNTSGEHDVAAIGTQANWVTIKGAAGERPVISTDYTSSCVSDCPRGFRLMPAARYIYITNFDMRGFIYIGIEIKAGAEHIVIDDIDMDSIDGIGVAIGDYNDSTGAKHIYLRDIPVTNSGYRDGEKRGAFIIYERSEDIVFEKCRAINSNSSGFRVYGWTGAVPIPYDANDSVKDLYLLACEVRDNGSTQANFARVYNLVVKNCIFANGMEQGDFSGLKFWGKELWLINSVVYNNHVGLELPPMYGAANIYLLHNTFVDNKWASIIINDYRYVAPGDGGFYCDANTYLYNNIFTVAPNVHYADPRCCFLAFHTNGKIIESNNNLFFGPNDARLFDFNEWVSEPYNRASLKVFRLSDVNDAGTGEWQTDTTYGPLNSDNNSISRYPLLDPGFTNMAGNDYSLKTGSIAVDAGVDIGITADFIGMERPQGSASDIGAYELYLPTARMLSMQWISVPANFFYNGTINNLVGQINCTANGYDILKSLTMQNQGTATDGQDIAGAGLWYQAGGSTGGITFDPNQAQNIGQFTNNGEKTWTINTNYTVNNGDSLYITVNILEAAQPNHTCKFVLPAYGALFQYSSPLEAGDLVNGPEQMIKRSNMLVMDINSLAPVNVIQGESGLHLGQVLLSNISGEALNINSLVVSLRDTQGNEQSPDQVFERLWLEQNGTLLSNLDISFPGSKSFSFSPAFNLADQTQVIWDFKGDIKSAPTLTSYQIGIPHAQSVNGGQISVDTPTGKVFPLLMDQVNIRKPKLKATFSNYPNPFQAGTKSTRISYYLKQAAGVELKVLELSGRLVKTLVTGEQAAGMCEASWDGRNERGNWVRSGVYLLRIEMQYNDGSKEKLSRKITVMR